MSLSVGLLPTRHVHAHRSTMGSAGVSHYRAAGPSGSTSARASTASSIDASGATPITGALAAFITSSLDGLMQALAAYAGNSASPTASVAAIAP